MTRLHYARAQSRPARSAGELTRSRRWGRPFPVVAFPPGGADTSPDYKRTPVSFRPEAGTARLATTARLSLSVGTRWSQR